MQQFWGHGSFDYLQKQNWKCSKAFQLDILYESFKNNVAYTAIKIWVVCLRCRITIYHKLVNLTLCLFQEETSTLQTSAATLSLDCLVSQTLLPTTSLEKAALWLYKLLSKVRKKLCQNKYCYLKLYRFFFFLKIQQCSRFKLKKLLWTFTTVTCRENYSLHAQKKPLNIVKTH